MAEAHTSKKNDQINKILSKSAKLGRQRAQGVTYVLSSRK